MHVPRGSSAIAHRTVRLLLGPIAAQLLVACTGGSSPLAPSAPAQGTAALSPAPAPAPDAIFVGAGDIAPCGSGAAEATARILDRMPGTVFTLGDHVYPFGTPDNFTNCYGPNWGRHRARTAPVPGNHDWDVDGGASYFSYFGAPAGPPGLGYYSYDLGNWHILALNSNIPAQPGSAQYEWARADLAAHDTACALAYWHHPLFNSGTHGNNGHMREMWRLLQQRGVEVAMAGHNHHYERFAPQDADGRPDPLGIRSFIVGTGGTSLYPLAGVQPHSEVRDTQTHGVLKLTLRAQSYDWEFLPVDGQWFTDAGTHACH